MTGYIRMADGSWLTAGSPEHLEKVWQEFTEQNSLPPNFEDVPTSPTCLMKGAEFKGQLHPLVLDAWAWHWHATYEATLKGGRTFIVFTYQSR
jgi:hypothetical protein